jgi:hypothetical protein
MGLTHASGDGDGSGEGTEGVNYYDGADVQMVDDYGGSSDVVLRGLVPEPESWALMIVGFTGMGALLRSRRRSPSRGPFGIETA